MIEADANAASTEQSGAPPDADLFQKLKTWIQADKDHCVSSGWYAEAKEAYDFIAGRQYSPDELTTYQNTFRQPITFNLAGTFVKAVMGIEINNRHDTVFLPRGTAAGPAKKSELLSAGSEYMTDECSADKIQSRAFQDAVKTGLGFIEQRLDYDENPDGKYVEDRISPLEMLVDHKARQDNAADARRLTHVKSDIAISDARDMFPGVPDEELHAGWIELGSGAGEPKSEEERRQKLENSIGTEERNTVTIVRIQWWEKEPYYRVANPKNPEQVIDASVEQYRQVSTQIKTETGFDLNGVKLNRKVYKEAYLGGRVLKTGIAPCREHFSWVVITGEPDENKGMWYGFVRPAKDPQKWTNKWLTQSLHILNTTAKGGNFVEEHAVDDIAEFNRTMAQPDMNTMVKEGALSKGMIQPKTGAGMNDSYIKLVELAMGIMPKVLGVNMEQMGLREVNQPGVLEQMRKQAGMTILATLFDSLRQARKYIGQKRLYFIQEYLADGRWIRVLGEDGPEYQQLVKDKVAGKYDVIVEDAPTSPDQKERTWALIQPMMLQFKEELAENPELLGLFFEYSPLPTKLVEAIKKMAKKPPTPEDQAQQQLAQRGAMAKVTKDEASAAQGFAAAQRDKVGALVDLLEAGLGVLSAKQQQLAAPTGDAASMPAAGLTA